MKKTALIGTLKQTRCMNNLYQESNKQKIALVTGATGFVGSNLVNRLVRDNWQTHIICRSNSIIPDSSEFKNVITHLYDGSTESIIECVTNTKPDVVFHIASMVVTQHESKDIENLIKSNVLFGIQLLEAMQINKILSFVNTGTFWQHYNNEDYNPVCLYAATKQAFEALLEFYVQACDFKAITLKLFDTYGPNDPRPKLFHLLNKAATSGQTLDMSAGEQLIDLVHIDDVIEAYMIAAQRLLEDNVKQHETYAVSSGKPMPLKELVELYAKITGQTVNVNWGARPYRYREVMKTWNKGLLIEDWNPQVAMEAGFQETTKNNS